MPKHHHVQYIDVMFKIQKWSYTYYAQKRECSYMQQLKPLQPHTELRITTGQQKISANVLAPASPNSFSCT